jgi:predicted RNA binding protein YcfA (HicA-like mRNA interferase family)
MKSVSGRDLARSVERKGWTLLRVHGSHHIYGRPASVVGLSVLVYEHLDLKGGLLRHQMKLAESSDDDL